MTSREFDNSRIIERDMMPISSIEGDSTINRVFKKFPILGDYQLSDTSFDNIFENAKKAINNSLLESEMHLPQKKYKLGMYQAVTLVVIYFAKKWNYSDEKFTQYIAKQFGYRDDSGRVWRAITQFIEVALKQSSRFLIVRNGDREFYETIMLHSVSPSYSWYSLFDLLFKFYTDNLDMTFVRNDPLFDRLVAILQKRLNNESVNDDYIIASEHYRFRVGIRRLIQERPCFCAKLFEDIVNRMEQLVLNKPVSSQPSYINSLIDSWFSERLSGRKRISSNSGSQTNIEGVAFDYGRIIPKYILATEKLYIQIPAIRIVSDYSGEPYITVSSNEQVVQRIPLKISGNELGQTIKAQRIEIDREWLHNNRINISLSIFLGNECIYNSARKMWRDVIVFNDNKETQFNKLKHESYYFYSANPSLFSCENVELQFFANTNICKISLLKDYLLSYDGNTLAVDTEAIKNIKVVFPEEIKGANFISDGKAWTVVKQQSSLKVYVSNQEELKKYLVRINNKDQSLSLYYDEVSENRAIVEFEAIKEKKINIEIIDIVNNRSVFQGDYYCLNEFYTDYSQDLFLLYDGNNTPNISLVIDGNTYLEPLSTGSNTVQCNIDSGIFSYKIPRLAYTIDRVSEIVFERYAYYESINDDSVILFNNTSDYKFSVSIGDILFDTPTRIELKKVVEQVKNKRNFDILDVKVSINEKEEIILRIVNFSSFVYFPSISFNDSRLIWDGGISFVGNKKHDFKILLFSKHKTYSFTLQFGKTTIKHFTKEDFVDGNYRWLIVDVQDKAIIADCVSTLGDIRKIRFDDRTIKINAVTEDVDAKSVQLSIKPVFLDKIRFVDTQYVDSEDGEYDVYSGNMFWTNKLGEKKYFSDKEINPNIYKLNPVKIIYINNRYLRIVNEDDDGIYCFNNSYTGEPVYEITDREPRTGDKNYKDILFYSYELISDSDIKIPDTKGFTIRSLIAVQKSKAIIGNGKERKQISTQKQDIKKKQIVNKQNSFVPVSQEDVIEASPEARILVNAGPGTGKTWTLIEKIIYLVEKQGIEAENIQVLCFSRAAVEVIQTRMKAAIFEGRANITLNYVDIRTFDSFASQLLYWVRSSDYTIIPKSFNIDELDYDGRINLITQCLKSNPDLVSQCEHLIVDEVQDLVLLRARMVLEFIKALPKTCGVTLLGDACQSIYDYQISENEMGSEQFYKAIGELGCFKYCSFEKNHRQSNLLQGISDTYRKAIMKGDITDCNRICLNLNERISDYDVDRIKDADKYSFDRLTQTGSVGILTRSNAQALALCGEFRKKNIAFQLKRRLNNHYYAGWIAYLFNESSANSFDDVDFIKAFKTIKHSKSYSDEEIRSLWNSISNVKNRTTGRKLVRELLLGINTYSQDKNLYLTETIAPITISTIHRSKGREYDSVILLDDLFSSEANVIEEHRVKYVALSRAKEHLFRIKYENLYFKTLENRRCYSRQASFGQKSSYLKYFEVGRPNDFDEHSFVSSDGAQVYIRKLKDKILEREVYLERAKGFSKYNVVYNLVVRSTGKVIAKTSKEFANDLQNAIREIKNLPYHLVLYENLYPQRFTGIFISDIASSVGIARGNEQGVRTFGDMITWNTLVIDGYAKAEY